MVSAVIKTDNVEKRRRIRNLSLDFIAFYAIIIT
jgi:hypothetical protein